MCPLARILRKELRVRGIKHLKVVYSTEEALKPRTDLPDAREAGSGKRQHSPPAIPLSPAPPDWCWPGRC